MITDLRRPFPLFVLGALLYAAAVEAFVGLGAADDLINLLALPMPLFGLPYLVLGGRSGWKAALYFLLLVPLFHFAAVMITIRSASGSATGFLPGAVGGVVGSLLSFAALWGLGLARPRAGAVMALAVAILTALGALGVAEMDLFGGTALDKYSLLLVLYLPWQIVFGFFLSRVMRAPVEIGLAAEPAPA